MFKSTAGHPDALINYLVGSGIGKRERFFLECLLNRLDKMIISGNISNDFLSMFMADIPDIMHVLNGGHSLTHIRQERGFLNHFICKNNWDLDDFIFDRKKEYGLL